MAILGGALILIAVSFALLVNSAIALAAAGPLAIGVMAGMVLAIAGIMVLAAALGPALTAGAIGFIAFERECFWQAQARYCLQQQFK